MKPIYPVAMKIKTILLYFIFISSAAYLRAEHVDVNQARKVAGNFLNQVNVHFKSGSPSPASSLKDPFIFIQDGAPVLYAFNTDPGFIIVSGDDVFTPVIGYAFEGHFSLEGTTSHYRGFIEKEWYSQDEWISMLQGELDLGHPIYYCGFNQSYQGHAFVCDGYQDDNFHFNFGWSGSGNGYYSLYNVNGFSESQACVLYFTPSDPGYPYHASGNLNITGKSGSFTDGSGPVEDYLNDQQASWLIDAHDPTDSITDIKLSFYEFDLFEGDTLKVYDGETTGDSLLGSFSGNTLPGPIYGTGDRMLITFASDSSSTSAGWYAEYRAHSAVFCSGLTTLTDPFGIIDDGSGTFNYHNNSNCMWRIEPPFANTITLTFNQFDTEEGFDFVRVYDGDVQVAEFSGHAIPEPVVATSGSIIMVWFTDDDVNFQGWNACYEVDNTGITETPADISLDIYPNPTRGSSQFVVRSLQEQYVSLRIYDLNGREVTIVFEGNLTAGEHTVQFDASGLPAGVYFYKLAVGSQQSAVGKIIKF
jgi:hypothetical protein